MGEKGGVRHGRLGLHAGRATDRAHAGAGRGRHLVLRRYCEARAVVAASAAAGVEGAEPLKEPGGHGPADGFARIRCQLHAGELKYTDKTSKAKRESQN